MKSQINGNHSNITKIQDGIYNIGHFGATSFLENFDEKLEKAEQKLEKAQREFDEYLDTITMDLDLSSSV